MFRPVNLQPRYSVRFSVQVCKLFLGMCTYIFNYGSFLINNSHGNSREQHISNNKKKLGSQFPRDDLYADFLGLKLLLCFVFCRNAISVFSLLSFSVSHLSLSFCCAYNDFIPLVKSLYHTLRPFFSKIKSIFFGFHAYYHYLKIAFLKN